MTYNIHHGEGMDGVLDLSRSAKIIASQAPDLCGLQEVDNYCTRTNKVGQIDFLAQKTSMTGTFGKFMNFQTGEYGMATLTAKPLISTKILQLPDGKYEPRSSIIHEVQLEGHHYINRGIVSHENESTPRPLKPNNVFETSHLSIQI